jgi:adenylosuccinate lyase
MIKHNIYESPFSSRYASQEMSFLFSDEFKFVTWRRLWIALAKAQKDLGLPIKDEQIKALESKLYQIDFHKAAEYEKIFRHDVMAHIHTFADSCPEAKGIIHLGATSCFVTDNTDVVQIHEGLKILRGKIIQVIRQLVSFAAQYAHMACLGFTHFQAAQPTTVGKRSCLWIQDFLMDLEDLETTIERLRFLGVKGATGTQASFLSLFENNSQKVKQLDESVAKEMGFSHLFSITSQTYTRKQDMRVFSVLTGIAASAHKFATDMRLLAHLKELEESFHKTQVGSSAMPYKRNPMRSERICGLARFLISLNENPVYTVSTQWLERSLDDSSNRRLSISNAFLCADAILNLLADVTSKIVVHPDKIHMHLQEELPFMATENILMAAVKKGKDRQILHEKLRKYSLDASQKIKEGFSENLLKVISQDSDFGLSEKEIFEIAKPENFIGRAIEQTHEFLNQEVDPILKKYSTLNPNLPSIEI